MKLSFLIKIAAYSLFALSSNFVFAAATPSGYPMALYDEGNVPKFILPDPLVMLNGDKVNDVNIWKQKRRPEILKLFATNVYGRTMVGRPDGMTWKVTAENRSDMNGLAITKTVTIYFTGKDDGPKMDVNIVLPAGAAKKPVPLIAIVEWAPKNSGFWIAAMAWRHSVPRRLSRILKLVLMRKVSVNSLLNLPRQLARSRLWLTRTGPAPTCPP